MEKAFEEGKKSADKQRVADMASLNAAIELKETRITELVVQNGELNKKIKELEIAVEDAKTQAAESNNGLGLMSMFNAETGIFMFALKDRLSSLYCRRNWCF